MPGNVQEQGDKNEEVSSTLSLGSLRNSLMPENALSAKFNTTVGPDLKQVSGTVYAGAHPGEEQRILWFKIEERLIPTGRRIIAHHFGSRLTVGWIVYTLWRHPQLVPLLYTTETVLKKLRSGANLMTPGLARGPPFPSKAIKDSIVAVTSLDKPSVPMVVGICEIDVASLQQVQGAKGHAVRGEHWDGDEIWAWSPAGKPGGSAPEQIEGWDVDAPDSSLRDGLEPLTIDDDDDDDAEEGGVSLNQEPEQHTRLEPRNEFVEGENAIPYKAVEEEEEEKELSIKGRSPHQRALNSPNADKFQKSTTRSGRPSYTVSTTIETTTRTIRVRA